MSHERTEYYKDEMHYDSTVYHTVSCADCCRLSQEYRSSSLFSGGVGGLIVSLYMLKTIWSAKASQRKREQLIIDETDERNLLIQKNSRAQAFNVSLIATLAASVLASLYHEEAINSCFNILLGIQLFAYLLIWMYYKRRL